MRLIYALLLLVATSALGAVPGTPDPIDSAASGIWAGQDRICRVVLSRYQTHWVQVDIRCQQFDGHQSASLSTIYAPGACPYGIALPLTPWLPNTDYISLLAHDPVTPSLSVIIGANINDVSNGLGVVQTWFRLAPLPSPSPYSCGPAPPRIDPHALARFCRSYPTVPACR